MNTATIELVKLNHYCALTGDTPMSVHNKRRTGKWQDGVHCRVAGDGNLWVNVKAAQQWAARPPRNRKKSHQLNPFFLGPMLMN